MDQQNSIDYCFLCQIINVATSFLVCLGLPIPRFVPLVGTRFHKHVDGWNYIKIFIKERKLVIVAPSEYRLNILKKKVTSSGHQYKQKFDF